MLCFFCSELLRQLTAADFASLVHRNFGDQKNLLRRLPAAEPAATKFQYADSVRPGPTYNACDHFLIAQAGFAAENDRLFYSGAAQ